MRRLIKGKKGQVLVISIAVIFIIFIFVIAAVEIGNLMYEKTHIQNIADSGAMEGGMWYARGMNILSLSNKVLAITGVAGLIAALTGVGEAGIDAIKFVQKAQDLIAGTGDMEKSGIKPMPLLCAAAVVLNGSDNKVFSLPLCNLADFDRGKWLPSFNVKRRYVSDIADSQNESNDENGNSSDSNNDIYYYTNGKTGEKVYVDKNSVQYNPNIKNRAGWKDQIMTKNDPIHGTKFLKREPGDEKGFVPLDIVESSREHSMLVVSIKGGDRLNPVTGAKFFKNKNGEQIKPAFLAGFSFVRISGGKLGIFELDGANYEPKLEHIEFPKIGDTQGLTDSIGRAAEQAQSSGNIGKMGEYLNSSIDILNSGILLH
jgi:hypothetical protein